MPTQDRSRQRVERMLDAAGHLFAEKSFDAATTEEIAERAGVSIGSLYQYFPNKEALFEALADRYLARARTVFETHMAAAMADAATWQDITDRAIDAFDAMQRSEIGGRAVWLNWARSARFFQAGAALNEEFASRVEVVLGMFAPDLPAKDRNLVGTTIVEIISAMLFLAIRVGGERGAAIVEETKVVVRRYLEPIAGAPRKPKAKRAAGAKNGGEA